MKEFNEFNYKKIIVHRGYLISALIFFIGGIVLNYTYRQYIYDNHIFDFHIADTLGSLICMPAYTCWRLAVERKQIGIFKIIAQGVVIFVLYEFLGYFGLHGVFDILDMVAVIISGGITYLVLRSLLGVRGAMGENDVLNDV